MHKRGLESTNVDASTGSRMMSRLSLGVSSAAEVHARLAGGGWRVPGLQSFCHGLVEALEIQGPEP